VKKRIIIRDFQLTGSTQMKCVSFDAFRTLHLPDVHYIKPEHLFRERERVEAADWVLFPEYWQVNALVFGLNKKIFPSLSSYLIGHDKVKMTRAFQMVAAGNIPWTLIEPNDPQHAERVWDQMPLPFVAKIPKSSMGQGVFLIENRADWNAYLGKTPVIYVQEQLPIDRDLRIIVVGGKLVAGFWRCQGHDGFHNNLSQGGTVDIETPLPQAAVDLVLRVAQQLEIDHAGFDVAMVDGYPYLLEFNRLFGNTGLQGLSQQVSEAIEHYLREQSERDDDPIDPTPPLPVAV